jgi:hypothetical protein
MTKGWANALGGITRTLVDQAGPRVAVPCGYPFELACMEPLPNVIALDSLRGRGVPPTPQSMVAVAVLTSMIVVPQRGLSFNHTRSIKPACAVHIISARSIDAT